MLWIFLLCIITLALLFLIRSLSTKTIARANSAKKSVVVRKIFRISRIILIVVFTLVLIILVIAVLYSMAESKVQHSPWLKMRMAFCLIIMVGLTYSAMSLPVNSSTYKHFKKKRKKKGYSLFLRGFAFDNYSSSMQERVFDLDNVYQKTFNFSTPSMDKSDIQNLPFSEKDFYTSLKKYMPVYCVGMTKELESPEGIKRIYLEESTWQSNVNSLIQESSYVFVLVNDSENCIWEINQCQEIARDKTIFIIDDGIVLASMWIKLGDNMPEGLKMGLHHSIVYHTKKGIKTIRYHNNAKGFEEVLREVMSDIL